ncbi:MAG: hypothetical protein R2909_05065 [Gemmatimonadales bacterium]
MGAVVGFSAFVILGILAATSPAAMVQKLGGLRWRRLHRLVYLAGGFAVLHFLWLVKRDLTEPLIYGCILAVLLLSRVVLPARRARAARAGAVEPELRASE